MNQQEIIELIAEALDLESAEISSDTELDQIGWDSMSMLSIIALAKSRFDKIITGAEIREFTTIGDILSALN